VRVKVLLLASLVAALAISATASSQAATSVTAASASDLSSSARCHSSYKGACLRVGIGDYDCGGGSGNGPNYVWKTVRVVGPDVFRLDADHNGLGCE
jgi:hypothetical protein